jgi:hypothetical protein
MEESPIKNHFTEKREPATMPILIELLEFPEKENTRATTWM